MSTTGPMTEGVVKGVLLALWRRGVNGEVLVQQLLRETLAPLPDVQEAIVALRRRGCLIEQTPGGVRLVSTGLPCWQDVLEELARAKKLRIGRTVRVFSRTGSTNDVAWQFAGSDDAHGMVVVADEQTAGRGRLGHAWSAKAEQSVLMSILLRQTAAENVDRMTLLAGLAAAQAVERAVLAATGREILGGRVEIKWPNDLQVDGKKLAGILVERRGGHVVVGIGMNVAQGSGDFLPEVAGRAISLYQATGAQIDRLRIAAELIEQVDSLCGGAGSDDTWIAEWKSRCSMLGQSVEAKEGTRIIRGRVIDVDPLHGLMLRDESGAVVFLSAQRATLAPGG